MSDNWIEITMETYVVHERALFLCQPGNLVDIGMCFVCIVKADHPTWYRAGAVCTCAKRREMSECFVV
jgi:hypothetical protein